MKRSLIALAPIAALAGCGTVPPGPPLAIRVGGPPLVSAMSPPAAESARSEPESLNSFPPGAANISSAPNATHPNFLSFGFRPY